MLERLVARRRIARSFAVPGDIGRMTIRLLVHVGHGHDEHYRQHNYAAGKRPAAIRVRRDVPFSVVDHQFLFERVVETIAEYTNQLGLDQPCRATGTPASGFGKKASKSTTFQGDRLSEVVSGT